MRWKGETMHEQLKAKLSQLHTTLAQVDQLDDDSKSMLKQLDTDIQRLLDNEKVDDDLNTRIEQQAVAFEGRHPSMSAVLKDMMDLLSKMGI